MKLLLLFIWCLLAVNSIALAHNYTPAISFLPSAQDVYLATVTSVDNNNNVTFTVNEVLRGKPVPSLILKPCFNNKYALTSQWVLASCSLGSKDSVGLTINGYCGWIPMAVMRKDGQPFLMKGGEELMGIDNMVLDMASDGTKGLFLDHVRRLLKQKPIPFTLK